LDRPAHKTAIQLFGRFEIRRGGSGTAIQLKSKKGRALLGYLAMHLDQPVPRSRIASLLWEDQPEKMGRQNLRQILAELREEVGLDFDGGISKENVQLDSRHFDVDAVRFLACARNESDPATAAALYTGDLTADLEIRSAGFDEWLSLERRRLHSLALDIFGARVEALDAAGDKKQALIVCERLLALDPLRETTHRLLLPLEAAVNGRGSALARAEALTKILREQLGVSPEPATIEMIEALSASQARPRAIAEPGSIAKQTETPAAHGRRYPGYALVVASVAVLGGALWYFGLLRDLPDSQTSIAPSSVRQNKFVNNADTAYSIAVIPFTVRSDSDQVRRFTSALEEDVIDSLSRAPRFLVISRQTSRAYLNTNKDAREIGRELNVEFLLSGNVDIDGDRLVVRAQLIDTQSGLLTWSNRFVYANETSHEVFEEIVLGVARELQVQVMMTEATKREKLERETPTYGDLILRGRAASMQSFSRPESTDLALDLFEKAAVVNPRHGAARVGIASVLLRRIAELRSPDRVKDLERADSLLSDVIKDHPENSSAHYFLGIARKLQGRFADSIVHFEKAIRLHPSNAAAYAQLAQSFVFLDRAHEAGPYIAKAIRLSPRDPTISSWFLFAGQAHLQLREYDDAVRWLERSVEAYPDSGRNHLYLAAAYLLNGNQDAAAKAAKKALLELPNFKAENLEKLIGDADPQYLAERKRIVAAIRDAINLARQTQ
jgi:DNA-binding SARP family transcriptional activator/TolB-like protein